MEFQLQLLQRGTQGRRFRLRPPRRPAAGAAGYRRGSNGAGVGGFTDGNGGGTVVAATRTGRMPAASQRSATRKGTPTSSQAGPLVAARATRPQSRLLLRRFRRRLFLRVLLWPLLRSRLLLRPVLQRLLLLRLRRSPLPGEQERGRRDRRWHFDRSRGRSGDGQCVSNDSASTTTSNNGSSTASGAAAGAVGGAVGSAVGAAVPTTAELSGVWTARSTVFPRLQSKAASTSLPRCA